MVVVNGMSSEREGSWSDAMWRAVAGGESFEGSLKAYTSSIPSIPVGALPVLRGMRIRRSERKENDPDLLPVRSMYFKHHIVSLLAEYSGQNLP